MSDSDHPISADPIAPKDLIDRHTIAEHVEFADAYFEGRGGHNYLYQKPFYHPRDCAPAVTNLGQLLAGLRLDTGMHVLDFAAGSCWLSRILIQLGCQVTSCDASVKALDIGRELFKRYPPVMPEPVEPAKSIEPAYLAFDGNRLNLADASVDRIVVNDAFHHIPNVATVLTEFFRVLKPGGIVGMSEPGRHHSQSPESQYEMRTFNVIENDFVLEDIWRDAQAAGFAHIEICPVLRHPMMDLAQYQACIQGDVPQQVSRALVQDTINHSIFFLHKTKPTESDRYSAVPSVQAREEFDEAFYLKAYPDVAKAVEEGSFVDAWQHFERHGRAEGRRGRG
ncbi:class I SAM-dependent methyltransferase [Orrella daihaiensis]|uniref:Class I SAM-dependent methyltransferase n=1 Tax=Orrella daihaiensis TaxID=2782176 RepID=A0ABY4AM75_9BURK|nr:class I SAM-dependent methyltransferase [Orrella daihaiensis]UOD51420.1 class I SAM-dependent methyltransferase [Orrella daihaiensis]